MSDFDKENKYAPSTALDRAARVGLFVLEDRCHLDLNICEYATATDDRARGTRDAVACVRDAELDGIGSAGSTAFSSGLAVRTASTGDSNSISAATATKQVEIVERNARIERFVAGTLINTPGGRSRVEDIHVGDFVITGDGDTAQVHSIDRTMLRSNREVRISANAFGDRSPPRDMIVPATHGLVAHGAAGPHLVSAAKLVNGTSVVWELVGEVQYYSIEVDHCATLAAEIVVDVAAVFIVP